MHHRCILADEYATDEDATDEDASDENATDEYATDEDATDQRSFGGTFTAFLCTFPQMSLVKECFNGV